MVIKDEIAVLKKSRLYSEELGIDLSKRTNAEYFKWFLASVLFGARITATIAENTYHSFARHGLLTPRAILRAGWDYLVNPVMREGGYVRYDEKTSREVLDNCRMLLADYDGSLTALRDNALNSHDLEARLLAFKGVGPITVNIFLRELRPYWRKADPPPLPRVIERARTLGIALSRMNRKTVAFARIEAGLLRQTQRRHASLRADAGSRQSSHPPQ